MDYVERRFREASTSSMDPGVAFAHDRILVRVELYIIALGVPMYVW